ncbi:Uncharacterized protein C6orf118 [Trichoplax sp. H2]|nr:Uncharacterized protein C6orf118 [Trichoplax sp. H2]|eukprot:RDD46880.1 Uncharacterized protein C6orf118 [Trichoplax sp. H2]
MTTKKAPNSLGDLLHRVQDVHRKDINDYCSGHLNHNKLWKAKDELYHKSWESSLKKPVIFVTPSKRVHIPVNKPIRRKMIDALVDYSVGPAGNLPISGYSLTENPVKSVTEAKTVKKDRNYVLDLDYKQRTVGPVLIEEVGFPDVMLPVVVKNNLSSTANDENNDEDAIFENKFINTYTLHAKRKEQYKHLRELDRAVVKCQSIQDRGMFRDRRVEDIEHKLQNELQIAEASNDYMETLNKFSNSFNKIITLSKLYKGILKLIKAEYDNYLNYLFRRQPLILESVRYGVQQLSDKNTAKYIPELKREMLSVDILEEQINVHLKENVRLREKLRKEEQLTQNAIDEIAATPKRLVIHVEEKPKEVDKVIDELHVMIYNKRRIIQKMKEHQKKTLVPATVCQRLDQCIKETEIQIQKVMKQVEMVETRIKEHQTYINIALGKSGFTADNKRLFMQRLNQFIERRSELEHNSLQL